MDNSMLFKALREFTSGLLNQLLVNLAGQDGQMWLDEFKKFLRKEPCWTIVKEASDTFLRPLAVFKLGATSGKDTLAEAMKVFRVNPCSDFGSCGIVFSGEASEMLVSSKEIIESGRFTKFLGKTAKELEKRRFLGSQFLQICREHKDQLQDKGYANFFVLTKDDERAAEDLSNVFVVCVNVCVNGELVARLHHVSYGGNGWGGGHGPRVFSPTTVI